LSRGLIGGKAICSLAAFDRKALSDAKMLHISIIFAR